MRINLYLLRETILNIIDILISPLRKFRKKLKGNNMIHVNYDKKDNYPHHKKVILFDRDAFQSLGDEGLCKVNKKYNVLCPQVFVTECLAPNKATEDQKKWLLRRLNLIENPIVLTGKTNVSPMIDIPSRSEYHSILVSEQIARNCIISNPITMERVDPEKLISHYRPRINAFKSKVKTLTEGCELDKGSLTTNPLISRCQDRFQRTFNVIPSKKTLKNIIRSYQPISVSQEPNYVAKQALQTVESIPINPHIEKIKVFLDLTDEDENILLNQIQVRTRLTPDKYPNLVYPIYIYFLMLYIIYARQYSTKHLDQSYIRDLETSTT